MKNLSPYNRLLLSLAVSLGILMQPAAAMDPARAQELGNLLVQDCGSCHGTRMKGGLGPPLTADRMQRLPEQWIVTTILEGRRGTAMPPWRALLTAEEATWLARALKSGVEQ